MRDCKGLSNTVVFVDTVSRMIERFGDRARFAIEVGPVLNPRLRVVDLWAANVHLTCDDNHAYVSQFCASMERTLDRLTPTFGRPLPWPELGPEECHRRLQAGGYEACSPHFFLDWGPTTDNLQSLVFQDADDLILTTAFWRPQHPRPEELGKVFVVRLAEHQLLNDLRAALAALTTTA
jgi:hypothetical protein